jgi:hypothetical protein
MRMGLNSRQLGGSRLDPDAKLYIATVQAALGATTIEAALPNATNPKKIISDFYKAEKDAGRYSLHKRIFLPIYNNLAANAVDAITATSGTFPISGSVTVAPGYVQGNGTTGYFNSNIGLPAVGGSNGNGSMWQIIVQRVPGINRYEGVNGPLLERVSIGASLLDTNQFILPSNNSSLTINISETSAGILIGSTTSTSSRFVKFLKSEVFTTEANTTIDTSTIPSGNLFFLARNNNNSGILFPHTERRGGYGFGLGLTQAQAEGYVLNLKSLYENLTGFTLP